MRTAEFIEKQLKEKKNIDPKQVWQDAQNRAQQRKKADEHNWVKNQVVDWHKAYKAQDKEAHEAIAKALLTKGYDARAIAVDALKKRKADREAKRQSEQANVDMLRDRMNKSQAQKDDQRAANQKIQDQNKARTDALPKADGSDWGEGVFDSDEPTGVSKEDRQLASQTAKLDKQGQAFQQALGTDNALGHKMMADLLAQASESSKSNAEVVNEPMKQLLGQFGYNDRTGRTGAKKGSNYGKATFQKFFNEVARAKDSDSIPHFDEMVDMVRNDPATYGGLMFDPESGQHMAKTILKALYSTLSNAVCPAKGSMGSKQYQSSFRIGWRTRKGIV